MSFKKISLSLLALVSAVVVGAALYASLTESKNVLPFIKSKPLHSLSGLVGEDGPVLAIKIDDTSFAHPQVGLKSADVVYIEQVEGGLTRLAAIFSSQMPALVGPVRSARISDIELLAQYGKIGFSYSGAQRKMLPVIAAANLFDMGANKYGPRFYLNEPTRNAPYAMMVKVPELLTEASTRGISLETSKNMGWSFGKPSDARTRIKSAHIEWPASSYDAIWSDIEERWLLNYNGKVDVDDKGYVLGPKNFVIQIVSITDSIYKDKVGGVTPFSATVGDGKCYLLRNGGYVPCLWSRASEQSGTTFTDLTGKELHLEAGQIWFALTSQEPIFTLETLQGATNTGNK